MKAKTIRQILKNKVADWIKTIDDDALRVEVSKNVIVTGGAIASMLLNEPVNDYDIYFISKDTAFKVAQYYISKFKAKENSSRNNQAYSDITIYAEQLDDRVKIFVKSAGIAKEGQVEKPYQYFEARAEGEAGEYVGEMMDDPGVIEDVYEDMEKNALEVNEVKDKYRPVFLSTNAITLSNKVQLVLRFSGTPEEIHKNYDFVHCTNWYTYHDDHLELRKEALECLLSRDLLYVGSKYPVCSIFRLRKFIKRGWKINAGQMLKIMMQISALDLTQYDVLQDQLTGVDCAYFCQILEKVQDKDPSKINYAYLVEIIDRMF